MAPLSEVEGPLLVDDVLLGIVVGLSGLFPTILSQEVAGVVVDCLPLILGIGAISHRFDSPMVAVHHGHVGVMPVLILASAVVIEGSGKM